LTELGYLRTEPGPGSQRWRLTPRALRLGFNCLASLDVWQVVRPVLADVAARTGLPCSAAVLDGDEVVWVARAAPDRLLRVDLPPGSRLPAASAAAGQVLLAGLDPAELEERLAGPLALAPYGRGLRERLAAVAAAGRAEQDGELEPGLWALAMPVRRFGRVVAAIDICGPSALVPLAGGDRASDLGLVLCQAAEQVGEALAHHPGSPRPRAARRPVPRALPPRPVQAGQRPWRPVRLPAAAAAAAPRPPLRQAPPA
jgi:IclR family pca regulon transcriptional regulator